MKVLINENTGNAIIKQIERYGLVKTSKLLGGFDKLISVSKKISGLDSYIEEILSGVAIDNYERMTYNFNIVGIDFNDIGDEEDPLILVLEVDLEVNFNNLTDEEIRGYKNYLVEIAQDLDFDIRIHPLFDKDLHDLELWLHYFNGEEFEWKDARSSNWNSADFIRVYKKTQQ
jgi:hypothetical protein